MLDTDRDQLLATVRADAEQSRRDVAALQETVAALRREGRPPAFFPKDFSLLGSQSSCLRPEEANPEFRPPAASRMSWSMLSLLVLLFVPLYLYIYPYFTFIFTLIFYHYFKRLCWTLTATSSWRRFGLTPSRAGATLRRCRRRSPPSGERVAPPLFSPKTSVYWVPNLPA